MKEEIEKLRKKLKKQYEDLFEVNERSDFPVHDRFTKEEDILEMKKRKKRMK